MTVESSAPIFWQYIVGQTILYCIIYIYFTFIFRSYNYSSFSVDVQIQLQFVSLYIFICVFCVLSSVYICPSALNCCSVRLSENKIIFFSYCAINLFPLNSQFHFLLYFSHPVWRRGVLIDISWGCAQCAELSACLGNYEPLARKQLIKAQWFLENTTKMVTEEWAIICCIVYTMLTSTPSTFLPLFLFAKSCSVFCDLFSISGALWV